MSWVNIEIIETSISLAAEKTLLHTTDDLHHHDKFIAEALENLATLQLLQSKYDTPRNPRRFKDSNKQSAAYRQQGNEFLRLSSDLMNMEKALQLYTKSITHATPGSKELGLGYANRGAALLKLNRPQECLEDIDIALYNNHPRELEWKQWARRGEAYAMLSKFNYITAKHWLNETPLRV